MYRRITIRKYRQSVGLLLALAMLASALVSGCASASTSDAAPDLPTPGAALDENVAAESCPVTEPLWLKPPEDAAVSGEPAYGHYFVNEDRSIWAAAWWADREAYQLQFVDEGIKVGWFRPAGAELAISGQRLDGQSASLEAHIPCCYPTRFIATGLQFPTAGCWQVTAAAAGRELSFIVWVEP